MPDENQTSPAPIVVEHDPNAASAAASDASAQGSPENAVGGATSSLKSGSSSADGEPLAFEQLIEQRFMKLEAALMGLPAAIHKTQSEGSHDTHESFGARVLQNLFETL
jgi:hypothetical protein